MALTDLSTCIDHLEHSANFRLNIEPGERHLPISKVRFSIAVTSWAFERYDKSEQSVQLHIETPMEALATDEEHEISVLQNGAQKEHVEPQLVQSLLTSLRNPKANDDTKKSVSANSQPGFPSCATTDTEAPPKKKEKGVRFEDNSVRVNDHAQPENLPLVNLCSGSSLCSRFHRLPSFSAGTCMGYLPGQGTSRHLLYRSQPQNQVFDGAETLALLLSRRKPNQRLNKLDKWRLVGALFMAVLQYHSPSWLQTTFMRHDILFFNTKH